MAKKTKVSALGKHVARASEMIKMLQNQIVPLPQLMETLENLRDDMKYDLTRVKDPRKFRQTVNAFKFYNSLLHHAIELLSDKNRATNKAQREVSNG